MTFAVRYCSRSGNTQKIADAIAGALGQKAEPVSAPLNSPVDTLFLGGALYAGRIDRKLARFLDSLTAADVKQVVLFSTAAGPKTLLPIAAPALRAKGIAVAEREFHCRGRFLTANREHPTQQDCADAAAFAKSIQPTKSEGK